MYVIAVLMRVLVFVIVVVAAMLLAMDAVAVEGRRMLGDRSGDSVPSSPVSDPSQHVGH
jgi:hypothetical protein